MARMPRLVVPGYPHHITQRGNRRMKTFFNDDDYRAYLELLAEFRIDAGVSVWAYCLMPNHVHLVVVPEHKDSLARLFRVVHRHYSRRINFRENWKGHLWQERFHSFVMDEHYLLATVRYTELNPIRARLCSCPADWPWSSARAHLDARDDSVVSVRPMLQRVANWSDYLSVQDKGEERDRIRRHAGTGRPAGDEQFISRLEALTGSDLKRKKPGPKPIIE
jgi:putative transposase